MTAKKKKKRIGKITCAIEYVVDIDDLEMVEQAKDCFYEDLYQAIVNNDRSEVLAMLEVKQDRKLQEKDIEQFLRDDARERHMDKLRDEGKLVRCKFCDEEGEAVKAHMHQGEYVCENCWDERLRTTE